MKLLTEQFAARFLVHGARAWADCTVNKLDDQWVTDMATAMGVSETKP